MAISPSLVVSGSTGLPGGRLSALPSKLYGSTSDSIGPLTSLICRCTLLSAAWCGALVDFSVYRARVAEPHRERKNHNYIVQCDLTILYTPHIMAYGDPTIVHQTGRALHARPGYLALFSVSHPAPTR